MSDLATLEKLEPFLAQVAAAAKPVVTSSAPDRPITPSSGNGRQGSHLELFFSEVAYSTFVAKPKPTVKASQGHSSNSNQGALKYSLRLH